MCVRAGGEGCVRGGVEMATILADQGNGMWCENQGRLLVVGAEISFSKPRKTTLCIGR